MDGTSLLAGGTGGGPSSMLIGRRGYHLHACFDLAAQRSDELVLTSARDAESLARHTAAPGEILIADRGYAKAAGLRATVAEGGHLIIRRGLTACRIVDKDARSLDAATILDLARDGTASGEIVDLPVWLPATDDAPALPLRRIIQKKPAAAVERSQKRAAKKAQRGHYTAKSKQLEAAQYLMLMTTLDEASMPATEVLTFYRRRWQIESAFKRLNSLAGLDAAQAKEERRAEAAIWAKLILAILSENLLGHVIAFFPSAKAVTLAPLPGPAPPP